MAAVSAADVQGQWSEGYMGYVLAPVGDVDGDGSVEVLVDEPGGGASGSGRIRLFSGAYMTDTNSNPDDWQILEWEPESPYASTGTRMAGGDFDGDGRADLVIGARTYGMTSASAGSASGKVYIYLTGGSR